MCYEENKLGGGMIESTLAGGWGGAGGTCEIVSSSQRDALWSGGGI